MPITGKVIPRGERWLHEPKFDGYRFQIVKNGGQVRLYSRGGQASLCSNGSSVISVFDRFPP